MLTQNPYFRTKKCSRVHSDREVAHSMPCALDGAIDASGRDMECEECKLVCAPPESQGFRSRVPHRIQGKAIAAQEGVAASWALSEAWWSAPKSLEPLDPGPPGTKQRCWDLYDCLLCSQLCGEALNLFSVAAVTDDHNLSGLKQHKLFLLQH